jgi:hypothetical protein
METLGRTRTIEQNAVDDRSMTVACSHRLLRLADLTNRFAMSFGIDNSYSASTDYTGSQQLAALLREAGFDGVHYAIRHDPEHELLAVAIFGQPSLEDPTRFIDIKTDPIPDHVVEEAKAEFGIIVI